MEESKIVNEVAVHHMSKDYDDLKFKHEKGDEMPAKLRIPAELRNKVQTQYKPQSPTAQNYIRWGDNDALPASCLYAIEDSPTAKRCVEVIRKYVIGNGFVDDAINDTKLIRNKTGLKLLRMAAVNVSFFNAVAYRLIYNTNREIIDAYDFIDIEQVTFDQLRKINKNYWSFNPYFNRAEDTNQILPVRVWEESLTGEQIKQEIDNQLAVCQDGEQPFGILYLKFDATPITPDYPNISYYSGLECIQADAAFNKVALKKIRASGMPPILISRVGSENEAQRGKNGEMSVEERWLSILSNLTNPDNGQNVFYMRVKDMEQLPKIDILNTLEGIKDFSASNDMLQKNVCITFGINEILIGKAKPGQLGNVQEVKNISKETAENMKEYQLLIEEALNELFPAYFGRFEIAPRDIFNDTVDVAAAPNEINTTEQQLNTNQENGNADIA